MKVVQNRKALEQLDSALGDGSDLLRFMANELHEIDETERVAGLAKRLGDAQALIYCQRLQQVKWDQVKSDLAECVKILNSAIEEANKRSFLSLESTSLAINRDRIRTAQEVLSDEPVKEVSAARRAAAPFTDATDLLLDLAAELLDPDEKAHVQELAERLAEAQRKILFKEAPLLDWRAVGEDLAECARILERVAANSRPRHDSGHSLKEVSLSISARPLAIKSEEILKNTKDEKK